MSDTDTLEDSIIWKKTSDVVELMYGKLHEFPEEEKWVTSARLRAEANYLLLYVAEGLGNSAPSGAEYEWGQARKYAFGVKALYRMAGRQHFIELVPEVMVELDEIIGLIEAERANAKKRTEANEKKELDHWLKKYELWKKVDLEKFSKKVQTNE